jgi:hypothetical protein
MPAAASQLRRRSLMTTRTRATRSISRTSARASSSTKWWSTCEQVTTSTLAVAKGRARALRDVADAGAHVEERRLAREAAEHRAQLGEHGAHPAEERVRAGDVGQRARDEPRVDVGRIEDLDAAAARRSERRRHPTA